MANNIFEIGPSFETNHAKGLPHLIINYDWNMGMSFYNCGTYVIFFAILSMVGDFIPDSKSRAPLYSMIASCGILCLLLLIIIPQYFYLYKTRIDDNKKQEFDLHKGHYYVLWNSFLGNNVTDNPFDNVAV